MAMELGHSHPPNVIYSPVCEGCKADWNGAPNRFDQETTECCCGQTIVRVKLPIGIAAYSGEDHMWKHIESNDTRCYEGDDELVATPHDEVFPERKRR